MHRQIITDNDGNLVKMYEKLPGEKPVGYMIANSKGELIERGRIFRRKSDVTNHITHTRRHWRFTNYLKDGYTIIPVYAVYEGDNE